MIKTQHVYPDKVIKDFKKSKKAKIELNDCSVRAIAVASGMSYDKAHQFVEKHFDRKFCKGTYDYIETLNKLSSKSVKLNRKTLETIPCKMNVGSFIKYYTKGTYIISVSGHTFVIKNGIVFGNKEDSIKLRRPIQGLWKVGSK